MRRVTKGDLTIIALVLLLSLAGLAFFAVYPGSGRPGLYAEIYQNGKLTQTVSLSGEPQEVLLPGNGGYNLLHISAQGVQMLEADCPNQDCVQAGPIDRPGAMLACLPHRLLVRLSGPKAGDYDAVSK